MTRTSWATFYFHGTPGSEAELGLFGGDDCAEWIVPDRTVPGASPAQDFDRLAIEVWTQAAGRPIRLVAFSLGTHSALEVAHRLASEDVAVDLISSAAPLQLGDFLGDMAGGPVFSMAQHRPRLFSLLAKVQSLAARLSVSTLAKMLFASAHTSDKILLDDSGFRLVMHRNLSLSLGERGGAYRRDIAAYVTDWTAILPAIHHPVRLWHGAQDNWSPPSMAAALASALPKATEPRYLDGLSHYSNLQRAIEEIGAGESNRQ